MTTQHTPEMVLWGFHPSHGYVPLKIAAYESMRQRARREAEGWTCAVYAQGDEPAGLALQADAASRATPGTLED